MKIFVAGSTGAVGKALVPQLLETGHEVIALSRTPQKAKELEALGAKAAASGRLSTSKMPLEPRWQPCHAARLAFTMSLMTSQQPFLPGCHIWQKSSAPSHRGDCRFGLASSRLGRAAFR